jgi:haloalkane dehalogenase
MDRLQSPMERFNNLPQFAYSSHIATVTDPTGDEPLTMAYLDEGPRDAAETAVLMHGEPTWSFLYRKVMPPLVDAGVRVIAPDLIGFGKSDKPSIRAEHTYARHVEWVRELLLDRLGLENLTLFGQDWGSLIGLRVVAENPGSFARVAIGNGGLPTGDERVSEAFLSWQQYSQTVEEFHTGRIIYGGCLSKPDQSVVDAYDAPFPDTTYQEGPRIFPTLVPTSPEDPAHDANVAAWEVFRQWTKPFLTCFSDGDAITRGADQKFVREIPGARGLPHVMIEGGGHFLQEDRGEELGSLLAKFATGSL